METGASSIDSAQNAEKSVSVETLVCILSMYWVQNRLYANLDHCFGYTD